jgi:DNA polymerase-3 subunit delta'
MPGPVPGEPLPWHEAAWQRLKAARTAGRLPHALLLQGPAGLGKRRFAELLARALFCASPDARGLPCGACRDCRLSASGAHPDLVAVEPEEGAAQIRIDAVRALAAWEGLTAHSVGHKVALVEPADAMNPAAANALLKTLEEPAGQTLILLVSAHPGRLPATIRSRCQRLAFSPPPRDMAAAWLAGQGVHADLDLLYGLSAGSPLKALALAAPDVLSQRAAMLGAFLEMMTGRRDPVALAEQWQKLDLTRTLEWLGGWAIDMVRLRTAPSPPILFNPDQAEPLRRAARRTAPRELHRLVQRTLETIRSADAALNAHLLLEGLLLEWCEGGRPGHRRARKGASPGPRQPERP